MQHFGRYGLRAHATQNQKIWNHGVIQFLKTLFTYWNILRGGTNLSTFFFPGNLQVSYIFDKKLLNIDQEFKDM